MDNRDELRQEFRNRQEKMTYYIIALCVTAIGFSVHKTMGMALDLIQIPLGLAVISWGASIYSGLNFIKYNLNALGMSGSPKTTTLKEWQDNNELAASNISNQHKFFYSGVVLFIAWHLLEMYNQSSNIPTIINS